jgi:hypothetical protein
MHQQQQVLAMGALLLQLRPLALLLLPQMCLLSLLRLPLQQRLMTLLLLLLLLMMVTLLQQQPGRPI